MNQLFMQQVYELYSAGRLHEAEIAARQVLAREPGNVRAMNVLGVIAHDVGRNDLAIEWLNRAIRIDPTQAIFYNNLGEAYRALADGARAIACFEQAIRLEPNHVQARDNLAIVYAIMGELDVAVRMWREILAMKPDMETAANNLGNALLELGQPREAAEWHRRAAALDKGYTWMSSNLLRDLCYVPELTAEQLLQEHRQWWARHGESVARLARPHTNLRDPDRRLIVGFVSPDFRMHSVAYFVEPIFANHDREKFQFIAYAELAAEDAVTARLKTQVDGWRSTRGRSDEAVEGQMRTDGVDVLIDLAGHTSSNRALVFARKPAPVQMTYLGYPATTGWETMDYRITDALSDPVGMTESHYVEKLARLRRTAWCYRPPEGAPEVGELPARSRGFVTFGSFNAWPKVNEGVISLWSKILLRVANSRLTLKSSGLGQATLQARVKQMFASQGVDPSRLTLLGRQADLNDHLGRYQEIDVGLDPFPYNGTTTTCEALWMGVPVIVLEGRTHMSRVGVSLLTNVGLQELIGADAEDYVERAVALATNVDRLGELRNGLRDRMQRSPLRDEVGMARDLEAVMRTAWKQWCGAGG